MMPLGQEEILKVPDLEMRILSMALKLMHVRLAI